MKNLLHNFGSVDKRQRTCPFHRNRTMGGVDAACEPEGTTELGLSLIV